MVIDSANNKQISITKNEKYDDIILYIKNFRNDDKLLYGDNNYLNSQCANNIEDKNRQIEDKNRQIEMLNRENEDKLLVIKNAGNYERNLFIIISILVVIIIFLFIYFKLNSAK